MRFIAQELREYMSKLGVRSVDELVGRSDLLKKKEHLEGLAEHIDVSNILDNPYVSDHAGAVFDKKQIYSFDLDKTLDEKVLLKKLGPALKEGKKKSIEVQVSNVNRTFGTLFGAEITRQYKNSLAEDSYVIKCQGAGGQSFGAFIPKGLTLTLCGDSNDYLGKGLSGGKIIVYPPKDAHFAADENIIVGNVALYGATSGKAFINGVVLCP